MYKCTNCSWEGTVLSEVPLKGKCPVCGDEVKKIEDTEVVEEVPVEEQPMKDVLLESQSEIAVKTPQQEVIQKSKDVEKKETDKKHVVKTPKTPDTGIEKHVELIQSMEDEGKDVHDMNFTELKKFCKEKGMDVRQKTKQQLLDWFDEKEKTTDFSEFLTDVNDLI